MAFEDPFSLILFGSTLGQYLLALGAIVLGFILGKMASYFVEHYLKALAKRTKNEFDDVVVDAIQGPLWVAFFIAGIYTASRILSLTPAMDEMVLRVCIGVFILIGAWFLTRIFDSFLEHFVAPLAAKTASTLDDQIVQVLGQVGKGIIILIAFLVMLSQFGFDVTAIVAGLGIGGVAIAFAAQATLADAFGGLSIFFSKPFQVGDVIQSGSIKGTVREIGIRYSRIRDFDNRLVTVPNSLLAKEAAVNWSSEPSRRIVMNLSLEYGTSAGKIEEARNIIRSILREQKATTGESIVSFSEFRDYSLNMRVAYYIKNTNNFTEFGDAIEQAKHEINLAILREFEKAHIAFAFPTQTVYLQKNP